MNGSRALRHGITGIVSSSVRARAGRALDGERAAERLDAPAQPDEAGAALEVGAADAVVGDGRVHDRLRQRDRHAHDARLRVLDRVGERLGDEVEDRRLDDVGQPAVGQRGDLERGPAPACASVSSAVAARARARSGAARARASAAPRPPRSTCSRAIRSSRRASAASPLSSLRPATSRNWPSAISRCWAPSWRSRPIRLRSSSAASSTLAREAISAASRSRSRLSCLRRSSSAPIRAAKICSAASSSGRASSDFCGGHREVADRPPVAAGQVTAR